MPTSLITAGDRKLLLVAVGVSLLLVTVSFVVSDRSDTADMPTTYSAGSGGAKAAYLLLEAAGYPVRRWEQSVGGLPAGLRATFIVAEPAEFPTAEERAAVRRFIENGGRVIAIGTAGAYFLPEHGAVPEPFAGLTWRQFSSQSPSSITRATPEITLAPAAYWDSAAFALPLYGDGDRWRVIKYDVGSGEAIWWASATPLTNAGLREPGNLAFFLACIGDPDRPVFWDEYSHGYRLSASRAAVDSGFRWIGLQLVLVAAAVLLTYSRRSGPTLEAAADNRLSPLEFVRTLGSLYQRAGAASIAVDITYQRFRYRLTRHLNMPSDAPAHELERAVRDRWRIDDPALGELLRACESARADAKLGAHAALKLTQSLSDWTLELGLGRESRTQKEQA